MRDRHLFLDFGGTLVASLRDPYPVYRTVLASHGVPVGRGDFETAWKRLPEENAATAHAFLGRTDEYWRRWDGRALRELGVADPDGRLGDDLRAEFVHPRWHAPFPESTEVLRRLVDHGYQLHVVSNHTEDLRRIVANLGWTELFATVTFSQEVGAEKPDRRIFQLALDRAGARASEVTHVGDSWEADVAGARAVGIRPIWLDRAGGPGRKRVTTVRDLHGLLKWIEGPR